MGTLLDITDSHAADAALRASEARARSVVATATDAYIEFDEHGRITDWNRQAEATFGWSHQEAVGQRLSALIVPPHHRELLEHGLVEHVDTGADPFGGQRLELTALDRTGRELPVEVAIWLIEAASPPAFGSFLRDISERRAVDRAKDEFVSIISHELRTPLASVRGAIGLLDGNLGGDLDERTQRLVGIALTNTDRLTRLIEDILDIERLEAGKMALSPQACDASRLVARSVELLHATADDAGVTVTADLSPRPCGRTRTASSRPWSIC